MLFGQADANQSSHWYWFFVVISVSLVLFPFVILLVVLGLRSAGRSRQLLHTERMRSIEMGHPLETPDKTQIQATYMHNAFWIAFWLGFGVPGTAFWSAAVASEKLDNQLGLGIIVWLSVGAASVAAVICATVLMIHSRSRRSDSVEPIEKPLPI